MRSRFLYLVLRASRSRGALARAILTWTVLAGVDTSWAGALSLVVHVRPENHAEGDPEAELLPCRLHITDDQGESHRPPDAPFWRGGFICPGEATLDVPPGRYHYVIERGPEWSAISGSVMMTEAPRTLSHELSPLADLESEGWFGGDLHVHRNPEEIPLHLQAEDIHVASVQTWWNALNPWNLRTPSNPLREVDGRFYHLLGGEDERRGGALLYHRGDTPLEITQARPEYPSSLHFLHQAQASKAGFWIEVEKPFWWDTPFWLATGRVQSIGLAHNHMNRSGVLDNEAWGRPRDLTHFPGAHGNGRYTQELYEHILNTGLRLPPSAGSASGVLPNPVGYNRVYVHTGSDFSWETWWEKLRQGCCFVTNGPLLRVRANGTLPGAVLRSQGDPLTVTVEGELTSRDAIASLEYVHNGVARPITLPTEITLSDSGWFLIRARSRVPTTYRFASTAPWYVEIDGRPHRPDLSSVSLFLQWARERQEAVLDTLTDVKERQQVEADLAPGLAFWEAKHAEAARGNRPAARELDGGATPACGSESPPLPPRSDH